MSTLLNKNVTHQPPEHVTMDVMLSDAPTETKREAPEADAILFLSDVALPKQMKENFVTHQTKYLEWNSELFINRSLQDIKKAGYNYIWINLHDTKARKWLQPSLNDDALSYRVVCVFSSLSAEEETWISSLKTFSDTVAPLKDVLKMKSLSLEELTKKMLSYSKIKKPPTCLGNLFKCIFSRKSKN